MSDCTKCIYKNDGCFCPPDKECTAFEKEIHKVKYTFEFNATDDGVPGEGGCWVNCPFSFLVGFGNVCPCIQGKVLCPFLQGSYSLKIKEVIL